MVSASARDSDAAEPDRQRTEVGVAADTRPLDGQVGHARAPLLDRGVSHVRAVAHHDLDDGVGERAPEVRRRVAVDERDLRAALGDQQRVREHRRALGVEVGERLQRQLDRHVGGHVEERAAGSERRVQRRELRAIGRHQRVQVRLDQLRVFLGGHIQVAEHDPLGLHVLSGGGHDVARVVVQHRGRDPGVVVCRHAPAVPGHVRHEVQLERGQVGVAPLLGPLGGRRQGFELIEGARADRAGEPRCDRQRLERRSIERRHPTEPSICSSIRRFSSTAYSIGSSRVIGSMNPFTIIAVASTSDSPRLIR